LHHLVLERWSRAHSVLHARDPRAKILLLLAFLIAVATTPRISLASVLCYACVLLVGISLGRLPAGAILARAAVVLPFSATFALLSILAGDRERALALLVKSYFSALAVLLLAAVTPLPKLLRGLESLGAPRILTLVVQFLYRYLFVISEQAQHMRLAALCRGLGSRARGRGRMGFQAAAGAVAVLFARSYARAQGIHRAMLARGFQGRTELLSAPHIGTVDGLFLFFGLVLLLGLRLFLEVFR
jgi:cobalt/nickel transport system permease protein